VLYFVLITVIGLHKAGARKPARLCPGRTSYSLVGRDGLHHCGGDQRRHLPRRAGEGYDKRTLAYVQLVLGLIIGRFIVGHFFLKPYYNLQGLHGL